MKLTLKKLIIQICCHNEEQTLPDVLKRLPREVAGFSAVQWLVVDDGSEDATSEVARGYGVDYVLRVETRGGLARAFHAGVVASLARGADVIVHTDADNQYDPEDIPRLVAPILRGEADVVVGRRPRWKIFHWSFVKKVLQAVGSRVVTLAAGCEIRDAACGFRAYSRSAAARIRLHLAYTYTLESLIQLGRQGFRIANVDIRVPPVPNRESP